MTEPRVLKGIGVSRGVAVGRAVLAPWRLPEVPHRNVPASQVQTEVRRLHAAVDEVRRSIESLQNLAQERVGPDQARIFEGQILMLTDADFLTAVEELIRVHHLAAEKAYEFQYLEVRDAWSKAESALLRERLADLNAVAIRVLGHLMGQDAEAFWSALRGGEPAVLVAHELSAGLTVELDLASVAGLVAEEGTRTSHAAILAHSLGLPAVMGVAGALQRIAPDETVIVDASQGVVQVGPTGEEIAAARARDTRRREHDRDLAHALDRPAVTPDGTEVVLRGNLDLPDELDMALRHRARGIGLVRTEFLITARTRLPSEDEQAAYFTRLAQAFGGEPVVVRTYDLGGDKFPAEFGMAPERNPFLGWRAIRLCLDRPAIFRPQVRAVLRAAAAGPVHLMIPLVTRVDEVEATRALMLEEGQRLAAEGVPAAAAVPLGVMVETPAAVVMADQLAKVSDFLSVGTNDLTQYTLVVDRGNAMLAPRFCTHDPAVLRCLDAVAKAARASRVPLSVCGEMASDPIGAFLLLGLGYATLSVAPPALPLIRQLVQRVPVGTARTAAAAALEKPHADGVLAVAREALAAHVDVAVLGAAD